jgi:RNA polymerase sigma-70 factor, ECF subfamily
MDKTALEQMITTHQDGLYRFAFFRTGSAEDAEDIVQNVFLNMYRSHSMDTVTNIKAYLYKSVHNACINRRREQKMLTVADIPEQTTETDNTLQPVLLKEQYKTVELLLQRLPAEQAEVIKMRLTDELNFAEIAALLQETESTIKSRFKYGLDKLKKIVKSKDYYHEMF